MSDSPITLDKPLLIQVDQPNPAAMMRSARIKLEVVTDFRISSHEEAELAAEELRGISELIKSLDDKRKAITRPLDAAKKATMDLFREPLETLEQAKETIRRAIGAFQSEQRRLAIEAQARAEAEAAAARKAIAEQAKQAAAAGDAATAEALSAGAELMIAPVAAVAAPKIKGMAERTAWKARVTDKTAFVLSATSRPELLALIEVDQSGLNKLAAATKGALLVAGVEFYEESIPVMARAA
jgi:hypothetical protein